MEIRKIDSITVLKGSSTGVGSRLKTLNTSREIEDALCKLGWTPPGKDRFKTLQREADEVCRAFAERVNCGTPPEEKAKKKIDLKDDDWCELHSEFHGNCLEELEATRALNGFFNGKEQPPVNKLIHEAFRTLTHAVHANAVEHGWFDTEMPNKEMEFLVGMAGVMKECGEALEVVSAKEWDVMDEKCPQHTKLSIELADVVLRLLTLCGQHGINLGAAITAKHEFNRSRPYRHGGKAF